MIVTQAPVPTSAVVETGFTSEQCLAGDVITYVVIVSTNCVQTDEVHPPGLETPNLWLHIRVLLDTHGLKVAFDVAMITILVIWGAFVIFVALVDVPSRGMTFRFEASFVLRRKRFRVLDFIHTGVWPVDFTPEEGRRVSKKGKLQFHHFLQHGEF